MLSHLGKEMDALLENYPEKHHLRDDCCKGSLIPVQVECPQSSRERTVSLLQDRTGDTTAKIFGRFGVSSPSHANGPSSALVEANIGGCGPRSVSAAGGTGGVPP